MREPDPDPDPEPDPEPDPAALARGLRTALHSFLDAAGSRRVLPAVFHVGRPGGRPEQRWAVVDDSAYDVAFRADLVARGLDALALEDPCPWLTRGGDLVPAEVDRVWHRAARLAYGRLGLTMPGFFVVTRRGWLNLAADDPAPVIPRRRRRTRPAR
ncbi:MAG: hypothetical protein J7518_02755 [Nocardioidaceae bacterium]|nr:hypothetical protein [Nocardioidaceae bacterium]